MHRLFGISKRNELPYGASYRTFDISKRDELAYGASYRLPETSKRDDPLKFASVEAAIAALQAEDEGFSFVLFEDFAHALYVEAHTLRGRGDVERLAPYLHASARASLVYQAGQDLVGAVEDVSTIIIGSMYVQGLRVDAKTRKIEVKLCFVANYTETRGGVPRSYYAEEAWTFSREAGVVSRPPARSRVIDCPHCGAPLDKIVAGTCRYCGVESGAGNHDWFVTSIVHARTKRGPMLTGTTEEVGTDLPTVIARDVMMKYAALVARDPEFDWRAFTQRVDAVFHRFHETWTAQDLTRGVCQWSCLPHS